MDSLDAKVSKENGGPLEDIVQTENSSKLMDDFRWLQESMSTEVTHQEGRFDGRKRIFGNHNRTK